MENTAVIKWQKVNGEWCLYGIENLEQTGDGYVYWKGNQVEHYSFSNEAEEYKAALELAETCRHLEKLGVIVHGGTVLNDDLRELQPGDERIPVAANWTQAWANGTKFAFQYRDFYRVLENGEWTQKEFPNEYTVGYHFLKSQGFECLNCEGITAKMGFIKDYNIPLSTFEGGNMGETKTKDSRDDEKGFTCGCCGDGFESTERDQAKFGSDAGFGICPKCTKYYS